MQPVGHTDIPIAIIGMGCRLPGADDLDSYWKLLSTGSSAIAELPAERLDQSLYYDPRKGQRGKTYCRLGAIVSTREFHRDACPIDSVLQAGVDNAHLLMCEVAATALRHAGLDPFALRLRNVGVYIGHAQGSDLAGELTCGTCIEEAAQFLREVPGFRELPSQQQEAVIRQFVDAVRAPLPTGGVKPPDLSVNMVAGTISKAFGLTGPFLAINSACASSLQAIQLGARALQMGRIDMAVVGGASDCKSGSLVLFSHAHSMSDTGSRPFDADADGLICSEGYVALVLKTLPRALADGDPIQAIVPGLGASSDGRGKSLWAPRKEGQIKAMERAYRNGLDMSTLQYIEAHATSTSLGDATELTALCEVLSSKFPPGKKIPVTSVKANIGHALESAGISGVIKTVLCMQRRSFVPAINIRKLNPKIDWATAPVFIPQQPMPWPEQPNGLPRRAGVNAFGIGGLNMHVVIEEFTESRRSELKRKYPWPDADARLPSEPGDAVAVIGLGCILPGAASSQQYWDLIASGRDPKQSTPAGRWRTDLAYEPGTRRPYRAAATLGGYITDYAYDWQRHKVPPKQVQQADPLQFMLLDAAEQALVDAGYDRREFDRTRVAVLVGTESGGDFGTQLAISLRLPELEKLLGEILSGNGMSADATGQITSRFGEVLLTHWPALIDESGSFSTSTLASRITKTMNLMGSAASIDASHASSAAALAVGVDALLSGDTDMILCAGGQRCMNLAQYTGMTQGGTLAGGSNPASPFDVSARGIVPGEGVGVVVLKRLSDAQRDGDRIRAIIRGLGSAHGAAVQQSVATACRRALSDASIDPRDVVLVETDGIGLIADDEQQLRGLADAYGQAPRPEPLVVSSGTGQIGHTLGASAMASLIRAILELEHREVPPTFGLQSPLPVIQERSQVLRAAVAPTRLEHASPEGRQFAAVNSVSKNMAFHILIERGERVPVAAASKPTLTTPAQAKSETIVAPAAIVSAAVASAARIVRLGADTHEALGAKLGRGLAAATALFAASDTTGFSAADRQRLAIVVSSAEELGDKLQALSTQWARPAALAMLEQQGCFYRQLGARPPRVAFLFPGQGSQYAGMLRDLVAQSPAAALALRSLDELLSARGFKTFEQMVWDDATQLGRDIWATQISMLLANTIVHAALIERGIRPDVIASHSYGEFAALVAAEVWDFDGALTAARARFEGIEATPSARGAMLATTAPVSVIESLAATLPDRAYVANYNAADQSVLGGRPETLERLADLLTARGHASQTIKVPCPFHTPLMRGAEALLEQTLEHVLLEPPRTPLLSSVTNRYVAEPAEIRANLAAQLTTPVRYLDLVTRLAGERDTVFVEVGPQQHLTKLNRRILSGRAVAGIIASDNPKRPGTEQLLHVQALLETLGCIASAEPVAAPFATAAPTASEAARPAPAKGTIWHVDATERRRNKMRSAAERPATTAPSHVDTSSQECTPERQAPVEQHNGSNGHRAVEAAPAPPAPTVPAAEPAQPVHDLAALEKFLIQFVVEQTGYPPEVVELDADLEADLGIDSIKKAQLFGELAEYFDVRPSATMTLDDFPTLRHVLTFLAAAPAKADFAAGAASAVAASEPASAASLRDAATPSNRATAAEVPPNQASSANAAQANTSTPPPQFADLEKFLINFVVEQTGYPPEVVELDADLEADLGIDSIKKAQLFGELAEYFDVRPSATMTLDDFPTLRHVLEFLSSAPAKVDLASAGASAPAAIEQSSAEPGASVMPAAQSAAQNGAAAAQFANPQPTSGKSAPPAEDLEKFLVNFVVEQTGYPPEVVELDADLEADLGIDSIKKAQLFGELAEYFDVRPSATMTLDDFPTLRHVLEFLRASGPHQEQPAESAHAAEDPHAGKDVESDTQPAWEPPARWQPEPQPLKTGTRDNHAFTAAVEELEVWAGLGDGQPATLVADPEQQALSVVCVAGSAYKMGFAHGAAKCNSIRRILRRFADLSDNDLALAPLSDAQAGGLQQHFSPDELEELRGMADAAEVPVANLVALNLAIDADLGSASAHVAVRTTDGRTLHAASQELPLLSALSECLEPQVLVRKPDGRGSHATLSFAGMVGALWGVNDCGLAVTAGLLHSADRTAGAGRTQARVACEVLAAQDIESALSHARRLPGSQAWNALLSHAPSGRSVYAEFRQGALEFRDNTRSIAADNEPQLGGSNGDRARPRATNAASPLGGQVASAASAEQLSSLLADEVSQRQPRGDAGLDRSYGSLAALSVGFDALRGELWVAPVAATMDRPLKAIRYSLVDLLGPIRPAPTDAMAEAGDSSDLHLGQLEVDTCQRFVLRMTPAPLPADAAPLPRFNGAALIVGDGELADRLRQQLTAQGVTVRDLSVGDDLDQTLQAFDRLWSEQPIMHLFVVTARSKRLGPLADADAWPRRREQMVVAPYFVCQRWVQLAGAANLLDRCTLVAATAMGGDFGFSGHASAPEGAAQCGLVKALQVEVAVMRGINGLLVKAIDAPADEPAEVVAQNIFRELAGRTVDYEVGYVGSQRYVQIAIRQSLPAENRPQVRPTGNWVFTGGARGITARCALELGRRYGLRQHLIGTSPRTPIDPAWRNLDAEGIKQLKVDVIRQARAGGQPFEEAWNRLQKAIEIETSLQALTNAGIEVTYHHCDVSDAAALARVLETIRRTSGPIDGIVHGAGIERACRFEKKKRDSVLATIDAKVDGAINLMRLTRNDPVRHLVIFGSISGRLGSNGQTDYCLASDLACKLAGWYRQQRPGVRAVGFHWHPWAEVGMAARSESASAIRLSDGPSQMPVAEGLRHLLRELAADAPEPEVLITSRDYHARYYGPQPDSVPMIEPFGNGQPRAPESPSGAAGTAAWPPVAAGQIASRFTLRLVDAPLKAARVPCLTGPAWIFGQNAHARELGERLTAAGLQVELFSLHTVADELTAQLGSLYAVQPPGCVFLVPDRNADDRQWLTPDGWRQRRAVGVVNPFMAAHQLFRLRRLAKDSRPLTIVGVTALGGDLGLAGEFTQPEGGALAGMIKSLYIEASRKPRREVTAKLIDTPAIDSPGVVAEAVLRELAADDPNPEVGWRNGRRSLLRSVADRVESRPKRGGPPPGVWVVTGGARGITAAAALELGKRYGLRLHLLGRSPAPRADAVWRGYSAEQLRQLKNQLVREAVASGGSPEKQWEAVRCDVEIHDTLQKFAAAGVQATYHCCELSDWDRLATVLDEIRRTDGPIEGIVHGAGYGFSGRFDARTRKHLERTLAGKVDGAVALMALTQRDPLRYWIGFGSISGRYGGNGLADYAAANDMLAKLIDWHRARRPECAAACFHWQSWDEIGMAMLGDSAVGTKGTLKMEFLKPAEGLEHFCREIEAGLPDSEVLITDGFFQRTFYPFLEPHDPAAPAAADSRQQPATPLIDCFEPCAGEQQGIANFELDPARDRFLIDHQFNGKPLLPAVIGLEAMAEAALLAARQAVIELRNVSFIDGLRFHTPRKVTARVQVTPRAGAWACNLVSDFRDRAGNLIATDRLHFTGVAGTGNRPALNAPMPLPPTDWQPFVFPTGGPMVHGPSLQGLRNFSLNADGGWAQLVALPLGNLGGSHRRSGWLVPATLIDAAFYACGVHQWATVVEAVSLPDAIERLQLGRMPRDHEACLVQFKLRSVDERRVSYDFTIWGADGAVIAMVEGYRAVVLRSPAGLTDAMRA